jgi:hypothetical protein
MRATALCMVLAVAAMAGCLRNTEFRCALDSDCGAGGKCEAVGFCSVESAACPGGRSYSDTAGQGLSSTCVPTGPGPGVDAGVDTMMMMIDGPIPVGCPSGYDTINGSIHRYKLLTATTWDQAETDCRLTSTSAYLAIPDDLAELADLAMVATAANPQFWIGLDDKATEGTFLTVKNVIPALTPLPWAANEPDDIMGGQDCVDAVSATQIATEKCGRTEAAVCECEP